MCIGTGEDQSDEGPGGPLAWTRGTIEFRAPEQVAVAPCTLDCPRPSVGPFTGLPADCWALGLTALEFLTGCLLFDHGIYEEFEGPRTVSDLQRNGLSQPPTSLDMTLRVQNTLHLQTLWGASANSYVEARFRRELEQLVEAGEDFQREATHFIQRLLDPNPARRMTAAEALRHPFLTADFPDVPLDAKTCKPVPKTFEV